MTSKAAFERDLISKKNAIQNPKVVALEIFVVMLFLQLWVVMLLAVLLLVVDFMVKSVRKVVTQASLGISA